LKRDDLDFHAVRHEHLVIHERLLNWRRYVRDGRSGFGIQPMFRLYRPERDNGHAPEVRIPIDSTDGHAIEIAVGQLPERPREAVRWAYVFTWIHPKKVCRYLEVSPHTLAELIHEGRAALIGKCKDEAKHKKQLARVEVM